VTWNDAWFDVDETKPKDWKDEQPVVTVGFLLRERPVVTVAHEKVDTDTYRGVTHIPRSMIRKVERL